MPGKSLAHTIATAVLTAFCLISWIVLMAGVGAFQSLLDDFGVDDPGHQVSYQWWTVWFALPLILGAGAAAAMKHPAVLVRPLALLFAVEFMKLTIVVNATYKDQKTYEDEFFSVPSKLDSRMNAMLAGGIMLSVGTLAMTVWLAVLDALAAPNATVQGRQAAAPGHAAAGVPGAGAAGHAVPVANGVQAEGYNYGPGVPQAVNYAARPDAVAVVTSPGAPAMEVGPQKLAGAPAPGAPPPNPPPM